MEGRGGGEAQRVADPKNEWMHLLMKEGGATKEKLDRSNAKQKWVWGTV
jgi:hypothetical protein